MNIVKDLFFVNELSMLWCWLFHGKHRKGMTVWGEGVRGCEKCGYYTWT
jgi:hypothetical protein